MKHIFTIFLCSILLVFGGCQAEEELVEKTSTEPFEVSAEAFLYEGTEEADVIAVDEEGYLYTATCITELEEGATVDASTYSSFIHQFQVYDLNGTCVKEVELTIGTGINLLTAKEGTLYCVAMKSELATWGPTLYTIDTKTWEVTEVYLFEKYSTMINFAMIDDYVYVIGYLKDVPEKDYTLHPDIDDYEYRGECVSRIKLGEETIKEETLPVDFPIDIVGTSKDTLVIYHYNEEKGFGFLEFDPEKVILNEVGWSKKQQLIYGMVQCKDGFLFQKTNDLYYGTKDGVEAKLSSKDVWIKMLPVYQRGFSFYLLPEGVERIGVNDLIKGNTPIHMLLYDDGYATEPYDNGYLVEKTLLGAQDYALKVLARDSDFDVYLLSSRDAISYNLKEKGAFYALNEVPEVMEYLDACFPYLKEAATNEDGDIWMIPVEVTTTALTYHKEYSAMREVDLSKMNFSEFLTLVEQIETKEPEKGTISTYMLIENLFFQYLEVYDSFDTEAFRQYAKQVKQINENAGTLMLDQAYIYAASTGVHYVGTDRTYTQEQLEKIPYFLYDIQLAPLSDDVECLGNSDIIGVSTMPKMSKDMGNIGTVALIAVNPEANNLEFTLEYISEFCKYMMSQKDTFLLEDETLYTDVPFIKEYYEVFKDGTVVFQMDREIYRNDFWAYLDGELELEEMIQEMERKLQIYVGE